MSFTCQSVPYRKSLRGDEITVKDRFLKPSEAAEVCCLGRSTLYKLEAKFKFPARVQLSSGRVGWLESDVEEYLRLGVEQFHEVYGEQLKAFKEQAA
ncbi:helix-turn-helix transcriptional regulator [Pseudoalteromonas luteoviolacea]|uniref:helix-turn-helix transcriptional regulator n=1 Tax=Pseudoalteromonas luteoviolacea TaxID=43657 RepID=UPI001B39A56C|nr:AlpA family phage regulatory protein [Pseudoalteromonas luteoviolacea]MBQ4836804.1 AlpA family phage regulatory protein [Pseudoalteromonas luteoviolacea]